jgi:type IV pilus assembly protein PilA
MLNHYLICYLKSTRTRTYPQPLVDKGFTLVELLVVVIIIGILSAVGIPSLLSQTNRARQAEAKSTLASISRAQNSYFIENSNFVTDNSKIGALELGLSLETSNYFYRVAPTANASGVVAIGVPKGPYKGYAYGQALVYQSGSREPVITSAACESIATRAELEATAVQVTPGEPNAGGGQVSCGSGTVPVK